MAEGARFELAEGIHLQRLSRPPLSTAQPPFLAIKLSVLKGLTVYWIYFNCVKDSDANLRIKTGL